MNTTDVSVTEFKGNATNLVKAVKQIDTASKNLDATLTSVLAHIQAIENGLKNVSKTTNISNKKGTCIDTNNYTIVGAKGTAFSSPTGRGNGYKSAQQDYHDLQQEEIKIKSEQVKYEKELTNYKRIQASLARQEADTRKTNSQAKLLTGQYRTSAEHLSYEAGLGIKYQNLAGWYAEKSAHPEKFLSGALLHNKKYQTGRALVGIGNAVSSVGIGGKLLGGLLDTIGSFAKSPIAGTAAAVMNFAKAIKDVGGAAVQAYSELEAIKTQLGVVFSNQTQADAMFGQISEYAVHSPFGVQQTSELAVLLKQSGVYASDLMDTLRMLGDTAGGNMEKMKRIANNYAQIVSIGKASMLDMRQFAYAGIPIFEAVSEELKVSQQELRKMISDGKVTSDIIEKVFKDLTGINGIFENATEKGAKTLKARLQNLADARQLAMGEVGERFIKLGESSGQKSYAESLVSTLEGFWEWVKEHNDIKNIERDVSKIAATESRIRELQSLLEYAKSVNDKDLQKKIKDEIEYQSNKVEADTRRNSLASSYDVKTASFERYRQQYGEMTRETIAQKIWEYNAASINAVQDFPTTFLEMQEMYGRLIEDLEKYADSIEDAEKVSEEEIKAKREALLLDAQQLAFDKLSRNADSASSLTNSFQELYSIYKDSEEYKEKQEAERIKRLEEAKTILQKIAKNTDETGRVNVKGYLKDNSVSDLFNLINQGAFTPGRKLDVVTGKSTSQKREDKDLLVDQIETLAKAMRSSFASYNLSSESTKAFSQSTIDALRSMGTDQFFDSFSKYYKNMENSLADLVKNNKLTADQQKGLNSWVSMYTQLLPIMLNTLEAETGGQFADLITEDKGKAGQEFIPLWKRILAQATGLSAEGITGTKQTLDNYRDDMAVRSLASGVMTAAIKTMDVASAMKLAKASNTVAQLQGAPAQTIQIDWKATRESVKNFATQLSASTEVISAYKNALEDEYNTFVSLVAAGYTTPESQDLKNQKYVSGEKYARLIASAGSQLVNAFGEKLITQEGKAVRLESDGKFYEWLEGDVKGQEVQVENLVVTESLFEIIKKTLPEIQKDLYKAAAAEIRNKAFEKSLNDIKSTQVLGKALDYRSSYNSAISSYIINNQEDFVKLFDSAFKVARDKYKDENGDYFAQYKGLEGISDSDLIVAALNGEGGELAEVIAEIFKEAIGIARGDIASLTDNKTYQETKEMAKQNEKLNSLYNTLEKMVNGTGEALSPGDYGGWRGARNWINNALGLNTEKFDKEDLYLNAARIGYKSDNVSLTRFKGTPMSDAEILERMSKEEKHAIDLEYHFEKIKNTIEEFTSDMLKATQQLAQGAWLAPFEQLGDYLITGKDYADGLGEKMKQLGAELLSQMGTYMARAGFSLVEMGALQSNWGLVAGGLALAAAGGFASGLGGALKEGEKDKDKTDKQAQKLENLKSELQKLLEQARTDALYYENNLRHKNALGTNESFSYKSVHDAVITPQGVVETDPKDFLIATKTPQSFMGGGVTVQPVINCNVVNNTSAQVRQEQQMNADGSIDIITIIEDVAGQYIASSKSDEAFGAREYRLGGKQAVM